MRLALLFFLFSLLLSCGKPKIVLICGDHICINKHEAEQYFEDNLTLEVKIIDKKNSEEIDLVQLNLDENLKNKRQVKIFSKKNTNENLKILTEFEKSEIKDKIKKKKKEKKLTKKNPSESRSYKKAITAKKIISKEESFMQNNVNKKKINVVDVCTLIEKCNIEEISKYLLKEGSSKGFPDISSR